MWHPTSCTPRYVSHLRKVGPITSIATKVFEEYQGFIEKYGDLRSAGPDHLIETYFDRFDSVIPTRYFLGRPDVGEEMHISIEKGKTLIIRLMAIGPVVEGRAQRDVWFEVNGEVC